MKYFFVLGNNTALSIAELASLMDVRDAVLVAPDFLVVESVAEISPETLIGRLGGVIKIGIIKEELEAPFGRDIILQNVINLADSKKQVSRDGKFNFGFSDYGVRVFDKKDLGLRLKKHFSEENVSSRFVVSREKTLSSVVIAQNKLLTRGIEIVLVEHENKIFIGETLAVQPFKDLSLRDFGRPARDDLSGMLPPKLAQIMINLAQVNDKEALIIDPFCGSGTILSEAIIMSYKNIFGSDVSIRAIEDTKKNISWMKELYKLNDIKFKFLVKNVLALSKFIKAESVAAIITEPYLGPQRGRIEFEQIVKELDSLYTGAIKEFYEVLVPGGRVVMIWPVFYGNKPISPNFNGFKIINFVPEHLRSNGIIQKTTTRRGTIIYGRPGQKVFREIVVLEKE
ncbi:MAG: hypothetical protein WCT50_02015 [Patescibacteria group bacterium]